MDNNIVNNNPGIKRMDFEEFSDNFVVNVKQTVMP